MVVFKLENETESKRALVSIEPVRHHYQEVGKTKHIFEQRGAVKLVLLIL